MENLRRRRFIAYFNGPPLKGSRDALMKATGLTKGRVSQLFDEKQPFGEVAAKNLALRLGLAENYFEVDHSLHGVAVWVAAEEQPLVQAYLDGLRSSAKNAAATPQAHSTATPRPGYRLPAPVTTEAVQQKKEKARRK